MSENALTFELNVRLAQEQLASLTPAQLEQFAAALGPLVAAGGSLVPSAPQPAPKPSVHPQVDFGEPAPSGEQELVEPEPPLARMALIADVEQVEVGDTFKVRLVGHCLTPCRGFAIWFGVDDKALKLDATERGESVKDAEHYVSYQHKGHCNAGCFFSFPALAKGERILEEDSELAVFSFKVREPAKGKVLIFDNSSRMYGEIDGLRPPNAFSAPAGEPEIEPELVSDQVAVEE